MRTTLFFTALVIACSLLCPRPACADGKGQSFPLSGPEGLILQGVRAAAVSYKGRPAVRLTELESYEGETLALVDGSSFHNGTIEVDLAGSPAPGAPADARGFVGIAFRVQPKASAYEYVYLRPTNGRAEDQLRRNHSTQYASHPDYPWFRLRKENPGEYESYVDLQPGEWTKLRVVVHAREAKVYVDGASQPCLIVNDLKLGDLSGSVGLWIGQGTEALFSRLVIAPE
jgi:hypothetical protein